MTRQHDAAMIKRALDKVSSFFFGKFINLMNFSFLIFKTDTHVMELLWEFNMMMHIK